MIYPIVMYGDPVLKTRAKDIEKDSIDVKALSEDMFETMTQASGIGLAAPQIGKSIRMFVVDGSPIDDEEEDMQSESSKIQNIKDQTSVPKVRTAAKDINQQVIDLCSIFEGQGVNRKRLSVIFMISLFFYSLI